MALRRKDALAVSLVRPLILISCSNLNASTANGFPQPADEFGGEEDVVRNAGNGGRFVCNGFLPSAKIGQQQGWRCSQLGLIVAKGHRRIAAYRSLPCWLQEHS
jgi:hypothetical protein